MRREACRGQGEPGERAFTGYLFGGSGIRFSHSKIAVFFRGLPDQCLDVFTDEEAPGERRQRGQRSPGKRKP